MSDFLLDTHAFLWFVWDDPLLSPAARQRIEDPANRKWVSIATCWEIAIKTGLKKLDLGEPAATFLPRELAVNHFGLGHRLVQERASGRGSRPVKTWQEQRGGVPLEVLNRV